MKLSTVVVVALLVACKKGPELTEHRFAGFTIGLPPGAVAESKANTYRAGSVRVELRDFPDDPLEILWIGSKEPGLAEKTIAFGDTLIQVSGVPCDQRIVVVSSTLPKDVAKDHHEAILKSVQCKPEPGGNEKPPIEILDLKLPAGATREPAPLAYSTVTYDDEATGVRYLVQVRPDAKRRPVDIRKEAKSQTKDLRDGKFEIIDGTPEVAKFSGMTDAGEVSGVMFAKRCPELLANALVIIFGDDVQAAQAGLTHVTNNAVCLSTPR